MSMSFFRPIIQSSVGRSCNRRTRSLYLKDGINPFHTISHAHVKILKSHKNPCSKHLIRLRHEWVGLHKINSQFSTSFLQNSSALLRPNSINQSSFVVQQGRKSIHLSKRYFSQITSSIITPRDKDPSLEYLRSGEKFENGPDQVIPTKAIYTWHSDGAVRISKSGNEPGVSRPPISIPTLLRNAVELNPNVPAMAHEVRGNWETWTYEEYYKDVQTVAKAFIALGLEQSSSVCILGCNSPYWFISCLAAIMAGGIPAGVYTTNSQRSCTYIARDSKANIFVVSDEVQLCKAISLRPKVPEMRAVIQYSGKPSAEGVLSWKELLDLGAAQSDDPLNARLKQMGVNKCATLIYTSGTTGAPKGVMLSHDNLVWLAQESVQFGEMDQHPTFPQTIVSYLPLSHVAAQIVDIYNAMVIQGTVYFARPDALKGSLINTLREVQPSKFVAVPRVWEKMHESLKEIGSKNSFPKRKLVSWAKQQGTQYNQRLLQGHPNPETFQFKLADKLVLSRVRKQLGLSQSDLNVTAAAPICTNTLEYFMSLNIIISEAYGLSECSGPHTMGVQRRKMIRFGSIGRPLDSVATKVCGSDDPLGQGELCIAGRHIMMGYLGQEEKTKDAIDSEGWFHTEDLSRMDEDGWVYITGRLKELLITAGGENVAPVPIEDNIKSALPCLSNAMVIGDKLKYLSVMITFKTFMDTDTNEPIDELTEPCREWLKKNAGVEVSTLQDVFREVYEKKNPTMLHAINSGMMLANAKSVSRAQRIQKWVILPADFSIPGGELGPTLKLKRQVVCEKYKNLIDEIYKDEGDPNEVGVLG